MVLCYVTCEFLYPYLMTTCVVINHKISNSCCIKINFTSRVIDLYKQLYTYGHNLELSLDAHTWGEGSGGRCRPQTGSEEAVGGGPGGIYSV